MLNWLKSKVKKRKFSLTELKNLKTKNRLKEISFSTCSIEGDTNSKTESQDAFMIIDEYKKIYNIIGIFDGHGISGKEASNAVSENFHKYFEKNIEKLIKLQKKLELKSFIKKGYQKVEKKMKKSGINYSTSGTCSLIILIKDQLLTISNLGNSRAILCRSSKDITCIELSHDHITTRKSEKNRIINKGGKIEKLNYNNNWIGPFRVWADEEGPGFNMTRTLGDFKSKKIGVISDPEIDFLKLKVCDRFLVLASDGLWDVMSSAEVCGFVLRLEDVWWRENLVAERVVEEARKRWKENNRKEFFKNKIGDCPTSKFGVDDVTVVIVFFKFFKAEDE